MSTNINCCEECECMITEEICGQIKQECGSSRLIWQAIGVTPCVTVKVVNTSNCLMKLKIKRNIKEHEPYKVEIGPKDEITLTVTLIKSIEVKCSRTKDESICTGRYSMCIHYPCDACKNRCDDKNECGKCNRKDWVRRDIGSKV